MRIRTGVALLTLAGALTAGSQAAERAWPGGSSDAHGTAARPAASPAASALARPVPGPAAALPAATPAATPAAASTAKLEPAPCPTRTRGKLIRVSISAQRIWLCNGAELYLTTPVTTGADRPGHRTRTGRWHISGAQTHRWLGGPGYSVQVRWWLPYDGDFGLHDAAWQTMPFGSPGWRTAGSHGCVHVPHDAMRTLYAWAPVGTAITIGR